MRTLDDFVSQFEGVIQQATLENAVKIAKGSVKDMEEYNRQVGRNEGLGAAVGVAKDMLKKMRQDDDGSDLPEMDND